MSDSENSITLPSIIRENLRSVAWGVLPIRSAKRKAALSPECKYDGNDPALLRWQEWYAAHIVAERLGRTQARLEAWHTADEQIGFTRANEAEENALDRDDDLAGRLWETPAQSVAGTIGKLHALLKKGQPSNHHEEFPWPQIRSVLEDLTRIEGGAFSIRQG